MAVLPGEPAVVAADAEALLVQAEQIKKAAEDLWSLTFDSEAKALGAVQERSAEAAGNLATAESRYRGTGLALRDYAVELRAAHQRANDAADAEAYYSQKASTLASSVRQLEQRVRLLEANGSPTMAIYAAEQELQRSRYARSSAEQNATQAHEAVEQARASMNAAAEHATALIKGVLSSSNQNALDHIGNFFEGVGDFFTAIAEWADTFFAQVWDFLKRVIMTVATLLFVVLLLVLIVAIAFAIATVVGWIALAVVVLLAAVIIISIVDEVNKPTPGVTPRDVGKDTKHPNGIGQALDETREVDDAAAVDETDKSFLDPEGSDAETVVKITKVVDEDGTVRWRVALPSTQEWLTWLNGKDGGGTNDLDSNLALMLTPALQTQYERAVMDAMVQAGVGKKDPVMLVGFSQGGIMAGHLAAYSSQYNWQAVIASGAPIDVMPIPSHITVVSVQHDGDPVPRLDTLTNGVIGNPDTSNWLTIHAESPDISTVKTIHDAKNYSATLRAHQDQVTATFPGLDTFFVTENGTNAGESATYYRWQE